VVAQGLVTSFSKAAQVHTQSFFHNPEFPKNEVTPSFQLSGLANVEITLNAPVSNSWFEASIDLVNETTGDVRPFDIGVEYYFGYDSDGSWREGSQISSRVISAVPEGTYHLEIQPTSERTVAQAQPIASGVPPEIRRTNYPDGTLKSDEPFVGGQLEGIAHYYHPNGKLEASIPYKAGKRSGQFTLYRLDGSREQDLSYDKYGELHGTLRWYNPDGSLKESAEYRAGKYDPLAKPLDIPYSIQVRRDVLTWSNFIWAMILVSLYPLWAWWRIRTFEMARWSHSDFSPYRSR
jgi:hypothetical protein